ncbi:MAG: hypothetical protein CVT95_13430 [Bacteroidetes bacterium HGW-Bacteroidetes-12]|nr:MAG: hypothetical protein CVT95_13430 [Bacteroidetes bacterium HGW-Bacteroidetes-12]
MSLFILGFSILLLVISVGLINNTIRLAIYSKRFLIRTMQLVGAKHNFISKPFVKKGIINGLFSAIFSIILLIGTIILLQKQIPELAEIQDIDMFIQLYALVIILGILITWISTYLAVKKYLRIDSDKLY